MEKKKIGVLISGSGTNLQSLIDNCESGFINGEVVVVISNKKSAFGLQRAVNHGIDAHFVSRKESENETDFILKIVEILKSKQVDLVVLAGYLAILSPEFISNYRNKIINIHPALIPSFCGSGFYGEKIHQAVLDFGAKITGVTVHFVDEGTDTGAIILQESVKVLDNDTVETLQKRVLKVEHKLLPKAVKLFCENGIEILETEGKRAKVKCVS